MVVCIATEALPAKASSSALSTAASRRITQACQIANKLEISPGYAAATGLKNLCWAGGYAANTVDQASSYTTSHRMNRVLHRNVGSFKQISQVPDGMLRLRDCQSIARHHHYTLGSIKNHRHIVGCRAAYVGIDLVYIFPARTRLHDTKQDINQGPIHRFAH